MATTKRKATTAKKTTKTAKSAKSTKSTKATAAKGQTLNIPKRVKSVGWMAILESIIIGALGIALILRPEEMRW